MKFIKEYQFQNTDPNEIRHKIEDLFTQAKFKVSVVNRDTIEVAVPFQRNAVDSPVAAVSNITFNFGKVMNDALIKIEADFNKIEKFLKILKISVVLINLVILGIVFSFISLNFGEDGSGILGLIIIFSALFSLFPVFFLIPRITKVIINNFEKQMDSLLSKILSS